MTPEVTTLIKLETVADLDGAKRFDDQQKKSQRTINSVTKDLQMQELMLRRKSRSYNFVKAAVSGATKEELKAILASEKNIARMKRSEAAMQKQNKTLRMMRGGFGQVGHQVQDVAVQLQGGTDAMIVFGQQGSQIVSLFGPGGAMLGAVLAVGAALITSFKPAVDESASAVKDFVKDITDQRRELGLLTDAEKELDAIRRASTISQINDETEDLQGNLAHLTETHDRYARMLKGVKEGDQDAMFAAHQLGLSYQDLEEDTAALFKRLGLSKATIDSNTNATDEGTEAAIKAAEADKERLENINGIIKAAVEEANTTGMSAKQQALYKATLEGASKQQLRIIEYFHDSIEAKKAEKKATDDLEKADKKRQDTINGLIKSAATQVATIGMTKRELDVYKATLQGATAQEISSINTLHDLSEARQQVTKDIEAQKKAQQELKKAEEDAFTSGINDILGLMEKPAEAARMQADERLAIAQEMKDRGILNEQMHADAVYAIQKDLKDKLDNLKGGDGLSSGRSIKEVKDDFEGLIESQKTEIELMLEHQQNKLDLVNEHEQAVNDLTIDYNEIRKKINDETNAYMQAASLAAMSTIISSAQQQVDTLRGFFDESSGLGKAFFVVSQAMAAANAIINGYATGSAIELAYANLAAMSGPAAPAIIATGKAHAAMAVGMGFATAAAIAGQTVASFEGGGMTFSGVRSGGMDGKGGRLAMVHPNEKITDMEKGGGPAQPVNVNINISAVDAKGVDELLVKRRGMITNLVRSSLANSGSRLG